MSPWVSAKSYRTCDSAAYHTREDCRHVGENHRKIPADHALTEQLPECGSCQGEHPSGPQPERTCPFCEETVKKLPAHLPCEESP